jgi:L-iditol 2-dehydrogenase
MSEIDLSSHATTMLAARLHGRKDLRVEQVTHDHPGREKLLRQCNGICGSDLHSYQDGRIGDTPIQGPLVLGHEFSALVEEAGTESLDGNFSSLCNRECEWLSTRPNPADGASCANRASNLCRRLHFCGNYPDGGESLPMDDMPLIRVFPVAASVDDDQAALLEPLGVAMHAVDLAKSEWARALR